MTDPYVYENGVLVNKFGIKDYKELTKREEEIVFSRFVFIDDVKGNYDYPHLKDIHKHIFGDIYDWAGQARTIPIEKAEKVLNGLSVQYASYKDIDKLAQQAIKKLNSIDKIHSLDTQVKELSKCTAQLWQVHPFREGNTRTITKFVERCMENKGIHIDNNIIGKNSQYFRDALVMASIGEYSKPNYLERIIKDSLESGKQLNEDLQIQKRTSEIANSSELKKLSTNHEIYDYYAKAIINNNPGLFSQKHDELIVNALAKDGKSKAQIQLALEHSPRFSNLSQTERKIQARSFVNTAAKEPGIRKLLDMQKELGR